MPGRGNPWQRGGHVDETVLSEDIEDGTIAEVDLDSALQAKVNSGGSTDLFAQTELLDDFYYEDPSALTFLNLFKYIIQTGGGASGALDQQQSGIQTGGIVFFEVSSTNAGDGAGFKSGNRFNNANVFDLSKNITMRVRASLNVLTDRFDGIGLADDNFRLSGAGGTLANFDASVDEGFYFKSEDGGNWIAVSNSQTVGSQTETDTGVSATATVMQDFEIIHEPSIPRDTFKINGSTVATHTTNIAVTSITAWLTNWITVDVPTDDKAQEIDLWHVVADR